MWFKISQELCCPLRTQLTVCFIDHSSTCLTHFHHLCSTPPPSTSTALPMTGIRRLPLPPLPLLPALLRQEDCCLAIWLIQLLSQVMSPRPASTSAVSTRRSTTLGEKQLQHRERLYHHSRSLRELRRFSSAIGSQR